MKRVIVEIVLRDLTAEVLERLSNDVDVRQVLRDALCEFVDTRMTEGIGTRPYVDKRYSHMDSKFRRFKYREVAQRCDVAEHLKHGDLTITVSEVPTKHVMPMPIFVPAPNRKR